jgi:hypothetical protein
MVENKITIGKPEKFVRFLWSAKLDHCFQNKYFLLCIERSRLADNSKTGPEIRC